MCTPIFVQNVYVYAYRFMVYYKKIVVRLFIMPTDAQKKAILKYKKEKLKRVPLDMKKEKYEEIKISSEKVGETVNGYIKKAIDQRMDRENRKDNKSIFNKWLSVISEPTDRKKLRAYLLEIMDQHHFASGDEAIEYLDKQGKTAQIILDELNK